MAIKEFNVDLDVKGRVLASTVPNSTGSIVTWNTTTNVFGLRTNSQIISDLGLTTVVNNSHTHNNKTVLDGITSAKVSEWNANINKTQGDTYYSAIGHTHTFASLTSKPTTIGGYGITDFNSLGDARWALRTRTITAGTGLTGGGNLTEDRTLNFDTAWGDDRYGTKAWINENRNVYSYSASAGVNLFRPIRRPDGSDIPAQGDSFKIYDITLSTAGTGTVSGYRGIVYYENGWKVYDVSFASKVSNHPYIIIDTDGVPKVRTNHNTNYSIYVNVRVYSVGEAPVSWRDIIGISALDAKADKTISITGTGGLTGGGNLTANRTIDLNATTKADIGRGVTAHGWGDFRDYGLGTQRTTSIALSSNRYRGFYEIPLNDPDLPSNFGGTVGNLTVLRSNHLLLTNNVTSGIGTKLFYGVSTSHSNAPANWIELWHSGNLPNPATETWVNSQGFLKTAQAPLTNSTTNTISGTQVRRAALTGDVTAAANSNTLSAKPGLVPSRSISLGTTDLNTLNDTSSCGFYHQLSNANATAARNYPGGGGRAGSLQVFQSAGITQVYRRYNNLETFRRDSYGGTWSSWVRIDVGFLTAGSNISISAAGAVSADYPAGTLALLNAGTNTTNRVWGAKPIADYVKQYAANNLGLQGVTDIGNWTSNAIDFVNGSNLAFTITNGINGSPHPQAQPTVGVPSIQALNKEFLIVNSSDSFPDFSDKLPHKFGLLDNRAVWANSFSFGSDFGFRFGYLPGSNGDWMSIGLDTQLHHTERLANATYTPAGGGYYNQRLHFPPENNATLATREWVLEGDSGTTPPTGDPSVGIAFDDIYRTFRLRNNFTFDHVNKAIDAVDTTYTAGSGLTLAGTAFSLPISTSGTGTYVRSVVQNTNGITVTLGTPPNTNTTYSGSTSITLSGTSFRRAALTGDVTASANSNATTIANNAVTHAKYQNIATQRILGRGSTGTGSVQELTLGSNLSLSTSGVLSATNTTYSTHTLAQLRAGTSSTNRLTNPNFIHTFVKEEVLPKQMIVTGTTAIFEYNGYTIILNAAGASITIGSSTSLPTNFEAYIVNNTNDDKNLWGASGITYKINGGQTTTGVVRIKANGIGTIIRVGSTSSVLLLGDFEI